MFLYDLYSERQKAAIEILQQLAESKIRAGDPSARTNTKVYAYQKTAPPTASPRHMTPDPLTRDEMARRAPGRHWSFSQSAAKSGAPGQ
jgi:hypothetical protein